jgi:hypothetical protein
MTLRSTCAQRYAKLESDRMVFLDRARECARVTIPMLMPDSGHSDSTRFYTPYQSIGARGVNNLSAKLLLSLLPPNSPFFRLTIDDFTLAHLAQQEGARAKVEEGLNKIERAVHNEVETSALRPPMFETIKQLIVSGNCLLYLPKDAGAKVYKLDRFVVQRDMMGNVLEAIVKEEIAREALPEDVQELLKTKNPDLPSADHKDSEDICIYTRFYRDDGKMKMYQEIDGVIVPGSEGSWPWNKSPILVLRWTAIDGEDYGRSYVEEYLGDLVSLDGLARAVVESAAASSKVVFMVNPNGVTREKDLVESENLDVITGLVDDVHVLQVAKQADMQVASNVMNEIAQRISQAFLLNSSVTRQAERVTAEEIRFMIGELEDALGGVYALLSQELQLPLVRRLMDRMSKAKKLPKLPEGVVEPTITTGLEALGRGHDLNKYNLLLQALAPLGPEALKRINMDDMIKRVGTSLGIDMAGLVKSQEEIQQEEAQAQQAQMQQMMAQGGADSMAPIAGALAKGAATPMPAQAPAAQ